MVDKPPPIAPGLSTPGNAAHRQRIHPLRMIPRMLSIMFANPSLRFKFFHDPTASLQASLSILNASRRGRSIIFKCFKTTDTHDSVPSTKVVSSPTEATSPISHALLSSSSKSRLRLGRLAWKRVQSSHTRPLKWEKWNLNPLQPPLQLFDQWKHS